MEGNLWDCPNPSCKFSDRPNNKDEQRACSFSLMKHLALPNGCLKKGGFDGQDGLSRFKQVGYVCIDGMRCTRICSKEKQLWRG